MYLRYMYYCTYMYSQNFKTIKRRKNILFYYNNCKIDHNYLFVAVLLVSPFTFLLPMFHLAFFSAVINSMTSFAWSEFVFWWIVWSEAGCTFKGFWYEQGKLCSTFHYVKFLKCFDGTLFSLLCRFHQRHTC